MCIYTHLLIGESLHAFTIITLVDMALFAYRVTTQEPRQGTTCTPLRSLPTVSAKIHQQTLIVEAHQRWHNLNEIPVLCRLGRNKDSVPLQLFSW